VHFDKLIADEFSGKDVRYETYDDVNSLIAIQGPKAAQALG
jgi:glycine cleavage system aminomethyltransferase T